MGGRVVRWSGGCERGRYGGRDQGHIVIGAMKEEQEGHGGGARGQTEAC